ncbi:MAG: hypothetical protein H0W62_11195 [Chitinophagales bacterium]|nr:hypothetical protein [Chitinophagales bacterium]
MKKNLWIVLVTIASLQAAIAQKPAVVVKDNAGWHRIATTVVDLKGDRDEIAVLGNDHFKSLKLKVTDKPVEITDLTVVYENDTRQEIPVRNFIKAGGETRVLDLEGKERAIKKIILMYKTVPNAKDDKSHVEIFGLK